jgi:hypothetical protein
VGAPALKQHVLPALNSTTLGVQIILKTASNIADVVLTFDITGYFVLTCSISFNTYQGTMQDLPKEDLLFKKQCFSVGTKQENKLWLLRLTLSVQLSVTYILSVLVGKKILSANNAI